MLPGGSLAVNGQVLPVSGRLTASRECSRGSTTGKTTGCVSSKEAGQPHVLAVFSQSGDQRLNANLHACDGQTGIGRSKPVG